MQLAASITETTYPDKNPNPHCTQVQEVHMELAANMGSTTGTSGSAGLDAVIQKAKGYERGNDAARAIETYLSVQSPDPGTHAVLAQCWSRAAALCLQQQRHRANEVLPLAAEQLMGINRFDAAAELFENLGDVQGGCR